MRDKSIMVNQSKIMDSTFILVMDIEYVDIFTGKNLRLDLIYWSFRLTIKRKRDVVKGVDGGILF